jgi:hypothetical protein
LSPLSSPRPGGSPSCIFQGKLKWGPSRKPSPTNAHHPQPPPTVSPWVVPLKVDIFLNGEGGIKLDGAMILGLFCAPRNKETGMFQQALMVARPLSAHHPRVSVHSPKGQHIQAFLVTDRSRYTLSFLLPQLTQTLHPVLFLLLSIWGGGHCVQLHTKG